MAKKSITGGALDEAQKNLSDVKGQSLKEYSKKVSDYVPDTTDQTTYDLLVKAVQDAADANESVAALQERISKLGQSAVTLARTIGILA